MTYRDARTWLKRPEVVVGVRHECSPEADWLSVEERDALVARLRHAEGRDCNVEGDVMLYRRSRGTVLVVETTG
jgi:hypothetical protein